MAAYDLQADRNVMEIKCKLSGQTFELHFRMPTNSERVSYENAVTKRTGSKIQIAKDWQFTQAKMGARLCTGFRKGDFALAGELISSDKTDPDYCPDWRNLLFKVRPDLFAHLSSTIFTAVTQRDSDKEDDDNVIEDLLDPEAFSFEDIDADAPASSPTATEAVAGENP